MLNYLERFMGLQRVEDKDYTEYIVDFKFTQWAIALFTLIALISCLFSTWYTVDKKEKATVRTFGAYSKTVDAGFHFKLPYPISKVEKTNVTEFHRMEIGFETEDVGPPAVYKQIPEEAFMLTGDDNIASVEFVVQFRINRPELWQFNFEEPEKLLKFLVQSGMRLIIGQSNFDSITTNGKIEIQRKARDEIQMMCDTLKMGVIIDRVNIQDALPPGEVGNAFKDVNNAKTDKEKYINQGIAHQNDVVPKAEGEASEIINEATSEAAKRLKLATGEVNRWLKVWQEYKKNPKVIRQKLSLELVPLIMKDSKIVIDKGNQGIVKHLGVNNVIDNINESGKEVKK